MININNKEPIPPVFTQHVNLGRLQIIVVAPEGYSNLGRQLAHRISKINGFSAAYWTKKQYTDTELRIPNSTYILFLGNEDENKITKDFLPAVAALKNRAGACFGYDGSKAFIFGEGKSEQSRSFEDVWKDAEIASRVYSAFDIKTSKGKKILAILLIPMLGTGLWIPATIGNLWIKMQMRKRLKVLQIRAAVTFFFTECFDDWVGHRKAQESV